MKKTVIKIFIFAAFIGLIFLGKKIIDDKTIDYTETIKTNLTDFYVNGSERYLDEIIEILNTKKNDDKVREDIQSLSYSIVGSWFTYLDNKYFCDNDNLNACKAQLSEFNELSQKLANLYSKKCSDGYTIIKPSSYSSLKRQADKKIVDLEAIVNNPRSTNPKNSEEIRLSKCERATDCECRDGKCQCYYTSNGTREEVTCVDPNPEEDK